MNLFKRLALWFTPERRQVVQMLAASLAPLFVFVNLATEDEVSTWMIIITAALQFFSNVLSLANVRSGDYHEMWAILRAAIYTAGAAIAPALVTLGLLTPGLGDDILVGLGVMLGILGNIVAVFTVGKQELDDVSAAISELAPDQR